MKKIFKHIMLVAVGIVGMLQLSSCKTDTNDWSVDASVTKQRPPSLKVVVADKDSATLNITATIDTLASVAKYELQVSTSPLTSNDAVAVEGTVYTFDDITNESLKGTACDYTILRENSKFTVQQNTTYYFRIRAIGKDGTISNWYTNGMLYYGGISNPTTAQKMVENTYCSLTTPATVWIDDASVGSHSLTLRWLEGGSDPKHNIQYATPTYLKNETTGEVVPISLGSSGVARDEDYANIFVDSCTFAGLDVNVSYSFVLLEADGVTEISRVTKATEYEPIQEYSYFIGSFPVLNTSSKDTLIVATDHNYAEDPDSTVTCKLIIGGAMSTSLVQNTNASYTSPFDKTLFLPVTPTTTVKDPNKIYRRLTTGGKATSSMEINVPADGRLYFYCYGNGQVVKMTITQTDDDGNVTSESTVKTASTSVAKSSAASWTPATKGYIKKGKSTITWDVNKAIYFFGIHYVPWEKVK